MTLGQWLMRYIIPFILRIEGWKRVKYKVRGLVVSEWADPESNLSFSQTTAYGLAMVRVKDRAHD